MNMAFAADGASGFIIAISSAPASIVMFILGYKISIATPTIGADYFVVAILVHS